MALYQVNDVLDVLTVDEDAFEGRVRAILLDAAPGSGTPSEYEVTDSFGTTWSIVDDEVLDIIAGPTFDELNAETQQQANEQLELNLEEEIDIPHHSTLTAESLREATQQLMETNQEAMRQSAERWANVTLGEEGHGHTVHRIAATGLLEEMRSFRPAQVREAVPNLSLDFDLDTGRRGFQAEANMMWGRGTINAVMGIDPIQPEPEPAPEPLPNEGRPVVVAKTSRNLTVRDYNPRPGGVGTLYSFPIVYMSRSCLMVPVFEEERYFYRMYVCETQELVDNAEWINTHQNHAVGSVNTIMDIHGVSWTTRNVLERFGSNTTGRFVSMDKSYKKSKKKLRRKHPIPDIKDEKYYASKDFIA